MRTIMQIILGAMLFSLSANAQTTKTLHDFVVKTIDGEEFALSELKGKKVMVVNVASKCGLTPQYKALQELYDIYKDKNFVIIGFPANNFLNQEPGTNEEIKAFCTEKFGVSFPMMEKISVNGDDIADLYAWLTTKDLNGVADAPVQWNFHKFLINRDGSFYKSVSPKDSPMSDEIQKWIKKKK